jgi:hypothetical protein
VKSKPHVTQEACGIAISWGMAPSSTHVVTLGLSVMRLELIVLLLLTCVGICPVTLEL